MTEVRVKHEIQIEERCSDFEACSQRRDRQERKLRTARERPQSDKSTYTRRTEAEAVRTDSRASGRRE